MGSQSAKRQRSPELTDTPKAIGECLSESNTKAVSKSNTKAVSVSQDGQSVYLAKRFIRWNICTNLALLNPSAEAKKKVLDAAYKYGQLEPTGELIVILEWVFASHVQPQLYQSQIK